MGPGEVADGDFDDGKALPACLGHDFAVIEGSIGKQWFGCLEEVAVEELDAAVDIPVREAIDEVDEAAVDKRDEQPMEGIGPFHSLADGGAARGECFQEEPKAAGVILRVAVDVADDVVAGSVVTGAKTCANALVDRMADESNAIQPGCPLEGYSGSIVKAAIVDHDDFEPCCRGTYDSVKCWQEASEAWRVVVGKNDDRERSFRSHRASPAVVDGAGVKTRWMPLMEILGCLPPETM